MQQTKLLHQYWKALEQLRSVDPEMPLQRASTFIYIATHEGCTIKSISDALGVVASTTNRNVRALGKTHRSGKGGHGLVISDVDPVDPRRLLFSLTPQGKRIATAISTDLGGN